jgi:hypothetical protein
MAICFKPRNLQCKRKPGGLLPAGTCRQVDVCSAKGNLAAAFADSLRKVNEPL